MPITPSTACVLCLAYKPQRILLAALPYTRQVALINSRFNSPHMQPCQVFLSCAGSYGCWRLYWHHYLYTCLNFNVFTTATACLSPGASNSCAVCPHLALLLTVLCGMTVLPLKLSSPFLAVPNNGIWFIEAQTVYGLIVRSHLRLASGLASNDSAQEHLQNIVV